MSVELEDMCEKVLESNSIELLLRCLRYLLLKRIPFHSHTNQSRIVERIQNCCCRIDQLIVRLNWTKFSCVLAEVQHLKIAIAYCIRKTNTESDESVRLYKKIVARLSTAMIELEEKKK